MDETKPYETFRETRYDGTIQGYNILIDRCGLNRDDFHILYIDPLDNNHTNKWTGHIVIGQFSGKPHPLAGVYLKPGDYYTYKLGKHEQEPCLARTGFYYGA